MTRRRRLTDWDQWVVGAVVFSLIGWTILIVMGFDPDSRTRVGFAAAFTAQVWAYVMLLVAHCSPRWLVD